MQLFRTFPLSLSKILVGLFLVTISTAFQVSAGVYKCMNEEGIAEFRDKPCEKPTDEQQFLPYVYERTKKDPLEEKKQRKIRTMAGDLQAEHPLNPSESKTQKKQAVEQRKRLRLETRQQKKAEKDAAKQQRRALRCQNTQAKLKVIEGQLHMGCKPKKCQRLKEQKAHFERMKQQYCSAE